MIAIFCDLKPIPIRSPIYCELRRRSNHPTTRKHVLKFHHIQSDLLLQHWEVTWLAVSRIAGRQVVCRIGNVHMVTAYHINSTLPTKPTKCKVKIYFIYAFALATQMYHSFLSLSLLKAQPSRCKRISLEWK